jgi:hypothetical protein
MKHYNNTCGVPRSFVSPFKVQGCILNQQVGESLVWHTDEHNSLKITDFWDVTPCSLVDRYKTTRKNVPPSSG